MNVLQRHRHLVFDFDGTIADLQVDWAALREAVYGAFNARYGFNSKRLPHMIEAIFRAGGRDRETLVEMVQRHEQPGGEARYQPIEGMVTLLRTLPEFYIVSNNVHSTVSQVLAQLGLLTTCRLIVGMNDVAMIKPSPHPFDLLSAATGDRDGKHYLYSGDSPTDEAFAANAGMDFIYARELI